MIHRFSVSNYHSIREEVALDLVDGAVDDRREVHLLDDEAARAAAAHPLGELGGGEPALEGGAHLALRRPGEAQLAQLAAHSAPLAIGERVVGQGEGEERLEQRRPLVVGGCVEPARDGGIEAAPP